jgi:hypothetical protein
MTCEKLAGFTGYFGKVLRHGTNEILMVQMKYCDMVQMKYCDMVQIKCFYMVQMKAAYVYHVKTFNLYHVTFHLYHFSGPPVSSTNKTDRHDITEILLKVALSTIRKTFVPD